MFDTNVYIKDSAKHIKDTIYEVASHVPYYRSIPLSMINDIQLKVNDEEVDRASIRISPDRVHWFTLEEAQTVVYHKWEYGIPLRIRFSSKQELKENVQLTVVCIARTAYIPMPLRGEMNLSVDFK